MININTDLATLQQLALENKKAENAKILENNIPKQEDIQTETNSSATDVEISNQAQSTLDNKTSIEDILSKNLSYATNIYDSLSNIRTKIAELMKVLDKPNEELSIEELEQLDTESNRLIQKVITTLNSNNASSLVNNDLLNIYVNGLTSLKNIQLQDNDYLSKLNVLKDSVKKEEDNFYNISSNLYNNLTQISNNYDTLVESTNVESSSTSIQQNIVNNADETLKSVCAKLTPETVIRLLQY